MSAMSALEPERYAAVMAAYAQSLTKLLARFDGYPPEAPARPDNVEPTFRRPDHSQGDRS